MRTTTTAIALLAISVSGVLVVEKKDKTIGKVVRLLQGMLDTSVKEGDEERKIYAKFKCYCDSSEGTKKTSIGSGQESISLLESELEEIQGDTAGLSSDSAELTQASAENNEASGMAEKLRAKEKATFQDTEQDLKLGLATMQKALDTLASVGADQTLSSGADNKQFMAGKKVLLQTMQTDVTHALRAASAFISPEQQDAATGFLQAPFTGTYTSQSAVVLGILKNMRDTFTRNLEDAQTTEDSAQASFQKLISEKSKAYTLMQTSLESKQAAIGANDVELSSKRSQLSLARGQVSDDEDFLKQLLPMCEEKAQGYAHRKMLRVSEEAAITEAISLLGSDEAFATFATTGATSIGATSATPEAFIQLRAIHRHVTGSTHERRMLQNVLQKEAYDSKSARLSKVVALLQSDNLFSTVLVEIQNMIKLNSEEEKADLEKVAWCDKERGEHDATLEKKKSEMLSLTTSIGKVTTAIEDAKVGLKTQIKVTEQSLLDNHASQATQTVSRTKDNVAYQQDVKNLMKAQAILDRAIKVLQNYYDDMDKKLDEYEKKLAGGAAFLQEDPDPAAMKADSRYTGQSSKGNDVLQMLVYIQKQTLEEETVAHQDEETAQVKYEESMKLLKEKETSGETRISTLQEKLAKKEKALLEDQEDFKDTAADKEETEGILAKIKPGCDFITNNLKVRVENRLTEKKALKDAMKKIKDTPAYKR